jgi:hypothetical protein
VQKLQITTKKVAKQPNHAQKPRRERKGGKKREPSASDLITDYACRSGITSTQGYQQKAMKS